MTNVCGIARGINNIFYLLSRGFLYLFLIHRAKLSQGMTPIFSEKYFTKIFPSIVWILGSILIIFYVLISFDEWSADHQCIAPNNNTFDLKWCELTKQEEESDSVNYVFLIVGIIFELSVNSFFLYLFVKPLQYIYQDSNVGQNDELKKALWYTVILTLIALLTSNITEIDVICDLGLAHWYPFDSLINMICSFLMLKRNRQFVFSRCRGTNRSNKESLQRPSFGQRVIGANDIELITSNQSR